MVISSWSLVDCGKAYDNTGSNRFIYYASVDYDSVGDLISYISYQFGSGTFVKFSTSWTILKQQEMPTFVDNYNYFTHMTSTGILYVVDTGFYFAFAQPNAKVYEIAILRTDN